MNIRLFVGVCFLIIFSKSKASIMKENVESCDSEKKACTLIFKPAPYLGVQDIIESLHFLQRGDEKKGIFFEEKGRVLLVGARRPESETGCVGSINKIRDVETEGDEQGGILKKIEELQENKPLTEFFFVGEAGGVKKLIDLLKKLYSSQTLAPNKIKFILFNPDLPPLGELEELEKSIGKINILNFKNRPFPFWSSYELGIPVVISWNENIFRYILPSEEAIVNSFRYMRDNYFTSPDASLTIIGIPPLFSLSGRR